jgi:hypothetical protein
MKISTTRALMAAGLALSATTAQAWPLDSARVGDSGSTVCSVDDAAPEQAVPANSAQSPDSPGSGGDTNWHIDNTFYLWFAGAHGNIDGFDTYNLGFKASPSDLLSHADFGLMDLVGVRYKRIVNTSDFLWITLSNTNTRVLDRLPSAPQLSAEVKSRPIIFTEKIGFRLINKERLQIDGLTGFRFWHLGSTLSLNPSPFDRNPYASRNWTDPLIGSRIQVPLSSKLLASIAGDVGGWGAGSQLDYQIVGALGYQLKPKLALQAGWRYLYIDYSGQNQFKSQLIMSGLILGVTYAIKGR